MEIAVDMTAVRIRISMMSPGTRKLALRSSGLNSTRGRKSMAAFGPPTPALCSERTNAFCE